METKVKGWIKLYRQSLDNGWLRNHKLWVFWCYCLLKASHKKQKVFVDNKRILLQAGQFVFGRRKASKETGLSEQSIRTCLNTLKTLENSTIVSTNKYSIVTVVNWTLYQGKNSEITSKTTNNQPATNQQLTTYKKDKKLRIKEREDNDSYESSFSLIGRGNRKGKDHRVKNLIDHFHSLCKEQLEQEPLIEGAKDGAAIKRILTKLTEDKIKNVFAWYIKSPKARNNGLSIAVALSNHTLSEYDKKGKWLYEG